MPWMDAERRALWWWFLLLAITSAIVLEFAPPPLQAKHEQERGAKAQLDGSLLAASANPVLIARVQPYQPQLGQHAVQQALAAGDAGKAIELLEPVRQWLSFEELSDLAKAYATIGDLQAAIQTWQEANQKFKPTPETLEGLSQAYLRLADFSNARITMETLLALKPSDAGINYQLGLLLAATDPTAATVYLERAGELSPELVKNTRRLRGEILAASLYGDRTFILVRAGRVLAALDEWGLAAEAFFRATLENPGYAEAWAYLGEARQHISQGDNPEDSPQGLSEIRKALQLDPGSISGSLFLSLFWSREERYDLAQQAVVDAIMIHPRQAVLYTELGHVLALSGDLARAAEAYWRAAELEPKEASYLRQIVEFSLSHNYLPEAIALPAARSALTISPGESSNLDAMAQVQIRLGRLHEAEVTLEQALKADPQYASAHLHYGYLMMLQGESAGALEQFQLARSLSPDSMVADQAQRLIEGMLK